jgi:hypothetical protein
VKIGQQRHERVPPLSSRDAQGRSNASRQNASSLRTQSETMPHIGMPAKAVPLRYAAEVEGRGGGAAIRYPANTRPGFPDGGRSRRGRSSAGRPSMRGDQIR